MAKVLLLSSILQLLLIVKPTTSANILFYFGVSTYSHRLIVWPLVETLAAKGHNVTFLSPFLPLSPNPNVTEYTPPELTQLISPYLASGSDLIRERLEGNHRADWGLLPKLSLLSCELLLSLPKFQNWVKSNKFDLVIQDSAHCECAFGLAYKWGSRTVYFKTSTIVPYEHDMFGIPAESSWIPDITQDFPQNMNFFTRIKNTFNPLYSYLWNTWVYHPALEKILREGLVIPEMPSIFEMFGNLALILRNSDYSTDYARSVPPWIVSVAGMVTEGAAVKPLSPELAKFADDAVDGFIFVSFGSAVQVSKMPQDLKEAFVHSFGNSSLRFIWKYETDRDIRLTSNVYTEPWMPQQAILNHVNCHGFITHGGLGSVHESVVASVPIIVIPIFADQDYNAERVERLGHGIKLEIATLTQADLQMSIKHLVENPSFKTRTEELSISLKDRQNSPTQTAVWWIEKVLRSSEFDLSLLKPLGRNQSWFVRRSLDVILFAIITLIVVTLILFLVFYNILNRIACTPLLRAKSTWNVKLTKKVKSA